MQQLKVLIADDEPIARDILIEFVSRLPTLQLVATCKNAVEAIGVLNTTPVDIMLLDINMPEISGMQLLKSLSNPPLTILTTAYSEYAVESYELDVVDYLLKPFSFDRFSKAISKAADTIERNTNDSTSVSGNTMFVKCDGKLVKIHLDELLLIEGVKDYVKLWVGDKALLVHSTMKNMEDRLSKYTGMLRVHKSYIINLAHVREIEGNTIRLGNHTVIIGSTYKDKFTESFNRHK